MAWSPSKRNNQFANSGIVVEINVDEDIRKYEHYGPLKGLEYQKDLERLAFTSGGRSQVAPAQRLTDFVEGKLSNDLNPSSYQPGLKSAPLHSLLPKLIGSRLRSGFTAFGEKMRGYYTSEANVVGVESRTSAPVNIPRNKNLEHPEIQGLFPCGEGRRIRRRYYIGGHGRGALCRGRGFKIIGRILGFIGFIQTNALPLCLIIYNT